MHEKKKNYRSVKITSYTVYTLYMYTLSPPQCHTLYMYTLSPPQCHTLYMYTLSPPLCHTLYMYTLSPPLCRGSPYSTQTTRTWQADSQPAYMMCLQHRGQREKLHVHSPSNFPNGGRGIELKVMKALV